MWEAITQGTTCVKMGWSDAYFTKAYVL